MLVEKLIVVKLQENDSTGEENTDGIDVRHSSESENFIGIVVIAVTY